MPHIQIFKNAQQNRNVFHPPEYILLCVQRWFIDFLDLTRIADPRHNPKYAETTAGPALAVGNMTWEELKTQAHEWAVVSTEQVLMHADEAKLEM